MLISRRSVLFGIAAAPLIVRPGILMPVRSLLTDRKAVLVWFLDGQALPLQDGATVAYFQTRTYAREFVSSRIDNWVGSFGG